MFTYLKQELAVVLSWLYSRSHRESSIIHFAFLWFSPFSDVISPHEHKIPPVAPVPHSLTFKENRVCFAKSSNRSARIPSPLLRLS